MQAKEKEEEGRKGGLRGRKEEGGRRGAKVRGGGGEEGRKLPIRESGGREAFSPVITVGKVSGEQKRRWGEGTFGTHTEKRGDT